MTLLSQELLIQLGGKGASCCWTLSHEGRMNNEKVSSLLYLGLKKSAAILYTQTDSQTVGGVLPVCGYTRASTLLLPSFPVCQRFMTGLLCIHSLCANITSYTCCSTNKEAGCSSALDKPFLPFTKRAKQCLAFRCFLFSL